jgi:hypothetical protein
MRLAVNPPPPMTHAPPFISFKKSAGDFFGQATALFVTRPSRAIMLCYITIASITRKPSANRKQRNKEFTRGSSVCERRRR